METVSHIEALNRRFGIEGIAQVIEAEGGLPMLRITAPAAHAEISLQGAQLLRWRPAGAEEVLFLSENSQYKRGAAIRGGIPVCFPWFRDKADNPSAPKHGFVRTREWRLDSVRAGDDGSVTVLCLTSSDDASRELWPHDFLLAYRIAISSTLRLELSVVNRGSSPFRFEEALHTYFRISQIRDVSVHGLDGAAYLDNTEGNLERRQSGPIELTAPMDAAFVNFEGTVDIVDPGLHRRLRTEKSHSRSTIVWTPWKEGAAKLSDLTPGSWQQMLCVEAGNILSGAVTLRPGEEHLMRVTLSAAPK